MRDRLITASSFQHGLTTLGFTLSEEVNKLVWFIGPGKRQAQHVELRLGLGLGKRQAQHVSVSRLSQQPACPGRNVEAPAFFAVCGIQYMELVC